MDDIYGIIDIGSNTMRLSCYTMADGRLRPLFHKKEMVGLAGYVNEDGRLSEEGTERAIETLEEFRNLTDILGLREYYVIATASLRNITNTEETVNRIREATGFKINVLSGEEEAMYDFRGTRYYSHLESGLVVDIGGGSTELVSFRRGDVKSAGSLPVGSLNMYRKYVQDLFPTEREIANIRDNVRKKLSKVTTDRTNVIAGVGGSIRACAKLYNSYNGHPSGNRHMTVEMIHRMMYRLFGGGSVDTDRILKIVPDRVHTIIPGLLILDEVCRYSGAEIIELSTGGLREGYLVEKITAGSTSDR